LQILGTDCAAASGPSRLETGQRFQLLFHHPDDWRETKGFFRVFSISDVAT
jgi:hypothetical protein